MMRFLLSALSAVLVFLLVACGEDNAYDGQNGLLKLAASGSLDTALQTLDSAVLKSLSAAALAEANITRAAIDALYANPDAQTLAAAQSAFGALALEWKKLQAVYVAGSFDRDLIDAPGLMDFFHTGNEDIASGLDAIIAGSSSLSTALYKNSHKSFDALEYLLFGAGHDNAAQLSALETNGKRRIEAAQIAAAALKGHLETIDGFFAADTQFASGGAESVEVLLNVLIDSAYKLKEWRVGDPGGFSAKYSGNPDAARLEYERSNLSKEAVLAILQAHQLAMDNGLETIAAEAGAADEAALVQTRLSAAKAAAEAFGGTLAAEIESAKMRTLYDALGNLHNAYYLSLINALSLTSEILEADGD